MFSDIAEHIPDKLSRQCDVIMDALKHPEFSRCSYSEKIGVLEQMIDYLRALDCES